MARKRAAANKKDSTKQKQGRRSTNDCPLGDNTSPTNSNEENHPRSSATTTTGNNSMATTNFDDSKSVLPPAAPPAVVAATTSTSTSTTPTTQRKTGSILGSPTPTIPFFSPPAPDISSLHGPVPRPIHTPYSSRKSLNSSGGDSSSASSNNSPLRFLGSLHPSPSHSPSPSSRFVSSPSNRGTGAATPASSSVSSISSSAGQVVAGSTGTGLAEQVRDLNDLLTSPLVVHLGDLATNDYHSNGPLGRRMMMMSDDEDDMSEEWDHLAQSESILREELEALQRQQQQQQTTTTTTKTTPGNDSGTDNILATDSIPPAIARQRLDPLSSPLHPYALFPASATTTSQQGPTNATADDEKKDDGTSPPPPPPPPQPASRTKQKQSKTTTATTSINANSPTCSTSINNSVLSPGGTTRSYINNYEESEQCAAHIQAKLATGSVDSMEESLLSPTKTTAAAAAGAAAPPAAARPQEAIVVKVKSLAKKLQNDKKKNKKNVNEPATKMSSSGDGAHHHYPSLMDLHSSFASGDSDNALNGSSGSSERILPNYPTSKALAQSADDDSLEASPSSSSASASASVLHIPNESSSSDSNRDRGVASHRYQTTTATTAAATGSSSDSYGAKLSSSDGSSLEVQAESHPGRYLNLNNNLQKQQQQQQQQRTPPTLASLKDKRGDLPPTIHAALQIAAAYDNTANNVDTVGEKRPPPPPPPPPPPLPPPIPKAFQDLKRKDEKREALLHRKKIGNDEAVHAPMEGYDEIQAASSADDVDAALQRAVQLNGSTESEEEDDNNIVKEPSGLSSTGSESQSKSPTDNEPQAQQLVEKFQTPLLPNYNTDSNNKRRIASQKTSGLVKYHTPMIGSSQEKTESRSSGLSKYQTPMVGRQRPPTTIHTNIDSGYHTAIQSSRFDDQDDTNDHNMERADLGRELDQLVHSLPLFSPSEILDDLESTPTSAKRNRSFSTDRSINSNAVDFVDPETKRLITAVQEQLDQSSTLTPDTPITLEQFEQIEMQMSSFSSVNHGSKRSQSPALSEGILPVNTNEDGDETDQGCFKHIGALHERFHIDTIQSVDFENEADEDDNMGIDELQQALQVSVDEYTMLSKATNNSPSKTTTNHVIDKDAEQTQNLGHPMTNLVVEKEDDREDEGPSPPSLPGRGSWLIRAAMHSPSSASAGTSLEEKLKHLSPVSQASSSTSSSLPPRIMSPRVSQRPFHNEDTSIGTSTSTPIRKGGAGREATPISALNRLVLTPSSESTEGVESGSQLPYQFVEGGDTSSESSPLVVPLAPDEWRGTIRQTRKTSNLKGSKLDEQSSVSIKAASGQNQERSKEQGQAQLWGGTTEAFDVSFPPVSQADLSCKTDLLANSQSRLKELNQQRFETILLQQLRRKRQQATSDELSTCSNPELADKGSSDSDRRRHRHGHTALLKKVGDPFQSPPRYGTQGQHQSCEEISPLSVKSADHAWAIKSRVNGRTSSPAFNAAKLDLGDLRPPKSKKRKSIAGITPPRVYVDGTAKSPESEHCNDDTAGADTEDPCIKKLLEADHDETKNDSRFPKSFWACMRTYGLCIAISCLWFFFIGLIVTVGVLLLRSPRDAPAVESSAVGTGTILENITSEAPSFQPSSFAPIVSPALPTLPPIVGSIAASLPPTGASAMPSAFPSESLLPDLQPTPNPTISLPTVSPTKRPTMTILSNVTLNLISLIVERSVDEGAALLDRTSPEYLSLRWLSTNKHLDSYSDQQKIQRFVLATLYYAMNGDGWTESARWMTDWDECKWFSRSRRHPVCNRNGEFVTLALGYLDVSGTLPKALGMLSNSLERIDIEGGPTTFITGTIPSELGLCSHMRELKLGENVISGSVPGELRKWNFLEILDLHENKLRGILPLNHANPFWPALTTVDLGENFFVGSIASSIGRQQRLTKLFLRDNLLDGAIPSQLGLLTNLRDISLDQNNFHSFPSEIGRLHRLENLMIAANSLRNAIPSEIGLLSHLRTMSLTFNNMRGQIPSQLGLLTQLRDRIDLSVNALTGQIPSEIASLTRMKHLLLQSNQLTGSLPQEMVAMNRLNSFRIDDNDMSGRVPDDVCDVFNETLPYFYADCQKIDCPCCIYCCTEEDGCGCRYKNTFNQFLCY